ncbi:MAG: DUF3050 domain-containing protein [Akkermansiaceae bacterium]|jgi:hypothetical protein
MKGRTHGNQSHPIMNSSLNLSQIESLQQRLVKHPVYDAVNDLSSLRVFMHHHVYGVWDFMSLLKHLQHVIAPTTSPWQPSANVSLRRFVNEIVLGEESDEGLPTTEGQKSYVSHFDLYCEAMREVQADPAPSLEFISVVKQSGLDTAFASGIPPQPSIEFMRASFGFIETGKAHVVAAAFAFGRELIVPLMFRALLERIKITEQQAPVFFYYLQRHIQMDEESHGPLTMLLLNELCGSDPVRQAEAEAAACDAIRARIRFWDGVLLAIEANPSPGIS